MNKQSLPSIIIRLGSVTALVAISLMLFPALIALADTFTVDMIADDSGATACTAAPLDCSLRGAITRANLNPGSDRIVLRSGEYNLTILGHEDDNKQGDLDIFASGGNVRISGAGADVTIIRGGYGVYGPVAGVDRVLHIDPGDEGGIEVEIRDVSIESGYGEDYGGGVYNVGNNRVNVVDSAIMSNTVSVLTTVGGGGGICQNRGTLYVTNTEVAGNSARGVVVGPTAVGGGIVVGATAAITATGSTVSGNEVSAILGSGSASGGGGLASMGGVAYIHDSTFSGNKATGSGGSLGLGGGIINAAGGLMVIDQDSTILNNDADLQGGGLANIDSAATIEGSTFQENRATGGVSGAESTGGGVYNLVGEVHIFSSTIHSNVAATLETMDELGRGGGIANSGGMIEIKGTDIRSNFADNGCGGILNEEGSTLTMEGGALAQNESEAGGGGLCNLVSSSTTMTGTTVTLNTAWGSGGAIEGFEDSTISLTRCMISGNKALEGSGGGIYEALGTLRIDESTLLTNYAGQSGGGMYTVHGTTNITGTTFYGNAAADILMGGTSDNYGGAMFLLFGETHVVNSTISGNRASEDGGGIYSDDALLSLSFTTVADNVADDDNDGNGDGGGLFDGIANPRIVNTILAGNVDKGGEANNCGGPGVLSYGDNIIKDRGCTIAGGTGTNLNADPLLGPLGDNGGPTDTHALTRGSPAIDRVTNDCRTYQALVMTEDQRGVMRPIGAACDIGAYEATIVYLPLVARNW